MFHEAIGSMQEGIHTIKTHKRQRSMVKIDLSKAYDMTVFDGRCCYCQSTQVRYLQTCTDTLL
jgi:hypothetical protein